MANEAVARPAATIVLLRDGAQGLSGPNLEVFMVVRHHAIDFASGALVFPGGRVEESDFALARNAALCANPDGLDTAAMAFRLAAIRETFEECGVLFARPGNSAALIDGESLRAVERTHRAPLAEGRISFADVLTAFNLLPATDLLAHFAHWITPRHQPKRYDTQFFLAAAPAEHLAVHDGAEAVDSLWITPRQVLADTAAGRFKLVFATQMNLMKLAHYHTAAEAIEAARTSTVVTVLPEATQIDATRRVMRIPLEAGYGAAEFMVDNPPAS
jgi:8-oxo-dGTP pyrophosphatase MutT (NUDIX family)